MEPDVTVTPATAVGYLRDRGLDPGPDATADRLGGGVSNRVVRVQGDRSFVLKQPLANLAVEDDWPADVSRVHNEAAAARAYADVVATAGLEDVRVPAVLDENRTAHVVVFSCAPEDADMWKERLLAGRVDPGVARSLGRLLGTAHRLSAGDTDLRERFGDKTPFDQLRVDPYHRTVAERHPDLAGAVRAEAERVLGVDRTLVHGDFSPKNVLVGEALWLLDFEVAHWGDPAFDTAFMLNHLHIKAVHLPARREALLEAVEAFWEAYSAASGWAIERDTVRELAVLMLARVDGKSPVEYTDRGTEDVLRTVASRALREDVATLEGYRGLLREVAA
jgi:5-methylthioribose kinase